MEDLEINARLINLETVVAHQEKVLEDLNEVVIRQEKEIDFLKKQNEWLKSALSSQEVVKPLAEETPPPHY